MSVLSPETEEVVEKLVAWEMFGRTEFEPKPLLRSLPLPDLSILMSNLRSQTPTAEESFPEEASLKLICLEYHYRLGHIGDWNVSMDGNTCRIDYQLLKPITYLRMNFSVPLEE